MGRSIGELIFILTGLVTGILAALWSAGMLGGGRGLAMDDVSVRGWMSDWAIGSSQAGLVTRARVARHGLLAMSRSEAIYFTRATDDAGDPLMEDCDYRLTGGDQPAEWWSLTLYDPDSRLPMNTDGALSLDRSRTGGADAWLATISARAPAHDGFWISSRGSGEFDLTLRLYRPSDSVLSDPETYLSTPSIQRLTCRNGAGR